MDTLSQIPLFLPSPMLSSSMFFMKLFLLLLSNYRADYVYIHVFYLAWILSCDQHMSMITGKKDGRKTLKHSAPTVLHCLNIFLIRKIKWIWLLFSVIECLCLVAQSCPTLFNPMDWELHSSVLGTSPGKNTVNGLPCPPPRDLPNPGIEPWSPALQVDSLPSK